MVASLDTSNDQPCMTFDLTQNGEPVRFLSEIPFDVVMVYGEFIGQVRQWENGGELHELLRHDD